MPIMKMEGHAMFNFLLSEANDWRSREQVEVDNTAGTEPMLAGTLLAAGATAADPHVAWTGTGDVAGILGQSVPAGEQARRTVIAREAEVKGVGLVLPGGSGIDAARTALAPRQIIVRTNEGIHIDPAVSIA